MSISDEQTELEEQLRQSKDQMETSTKYSPQWMDARAIYNAASNRLHRMSMPMQVIHKLVGIYGGDYTSEGDGKS